MFKRTLIISASALSLIACASAQIKTGQSLTAAVQAETTAAQQAHTAYASGLLSKAGVVQVDAWGKEAVAAAMTARCAYEAGDLTTTTAAIAEIGDLALAILAEKNGTPLPTITPTTAQTCANPAPASSVIVGG